MNLQSSIKQIMFIPETKKNMILKWFSSLIIMQTNLIEILHKVKKLETEVKKSCRGSILLQFLVDVIVAIRDTTRDH